MGMDWRICVVCISAMLGTRAYGCFCVSTPMCSQVETYRESSAVFVGRVVDVWPPRQELANESEHLSLSMLRHLILQRWHGALSAEEEQYIRAAPDRAALELRYALIQRVRFVVNEVLAGPRVREIYTDGSSCGYRFEQGQDYLVNSVRDGPRFQTGACSRTSRVESADAVEDLKALRAWKSGRRLPPRIYGRIDSADLRTDTRVRLINDRKEYALSLGADGRFSLDGLEKTKYRLRIQDGRGKGERAIDLSTFGCFEAAPWFDGVWHIAGSPLQPDPPSGR
jgi:hypothetical protein